jgi:hypothetical protein
VRMGLGSAAGLTPRLAAVREPVVCWYAQHGQPPTWQPIAPARLYRTEHAVSLADMLHALRRVLLAAQFLPSRRVMLTPEKLLHA